MSTTDPLAPLLARLPVPPEDELLAALQQTPDAPLEGLAAALRANPRLRPALARGTSLTAWVTPFLLHQVPRQATNSETQIAAGVTGQVLAACGALPSELIETLWQHVRQEHPLGFMHPVVWPGAHGLALLALVASPEAPPDALRIAAAVRGWSTGPNVVALAHPRADDRVRDAALRRLEVNALDSNGDTRLLRQAMACRAIRETPRFDARLDAVLRQLALRVVGFEVYADLLAWHAVCSPGPTFGDLFREAADRYRAAALVRIESLGGDIEADWDYLEDLLYQRLLNELQALPASERELRLRTLRPVDLLPALCSTDDATRHCAVAWLGLVGPPISIDAEGESTLETRRASAEAGVTEATASLMPHSAAVGRRSSPHR